MIVYGGGYIQKERECPVCGKMFVPAPQHVFVEDDVILCKWTCLCAYRKQRKEKKEKRKETSARRRRYTREERAEVVRSVVIDGRKMSEIATEKKIAYTTVGKWVDEYKAGGFKI